MTISAQALRDLHRIHQQLADLRGRLDRGPKQIQAGRQAVERGEKQLADAKEAWKKTRMESDDQQMQLEGRETKTEDLKRKLNECKRNEEYKILKDQIAAEKQASSVLEDEVLDKLEKIDRLSERLKEAEASLEKARDQLEKTQERVGEQQVSLEIDFARITDELNRAEAGLPADFKSDYQRVIRAHGDRGLAPAEGESCGSCFTILSPQTMNDLYLSKPVFCRSCGCLLYLLEDRKVGDHAGSSD
ncbi:MAG: phospholipase [Planctomycetes bacterium]|nr:phospholipase [Planctomycetota bacterium]MBL7042389.1 phospholipase [Pirellulaceae bacterium]